MTAISKQYFIMNSTGCTGARCSNRDVPHCVQPDHHFLTANDLTKVRHSTSRPERQATCRDQDVTRESRSDRLRLVHLEFE